MEIIKISQKNSYINASKSTTCHLKRGKARLWFLDGYANVNENIAVRVALYYLQDLHFVNLRIVRKITGILLNASKLGN